MCARCILYCLTLESLSDGEAHETSAAICVQRRSSVVVYAICCCSSPDQSFACWYGCSSESCVWLWRLHTSETYMCVHFVFKLLIIQILRKYVYIYIYVYTCIYIICIYVYIYIYIMYVYICIYPLVSLWATRVLKARLKMLLPVTLSDFATTLQPTTFAGFVDQNVVDLYHQLGISFSPPFGHVPSSLPYPSQAAR